MVREAIAESGERVGAVTRVARQLGIGPESSRNWVKRMSIHRRGEYDEGWCTLLSPHQMAHSGPPADGPRREIPCDTHSRGWNHRDSRPARTRHRTIRGAR